MKKILIILFGIFFLVGCNKEVIDVYDIINDQNEKKIYQVGEVISLNIDQYLSRYDFSRVQFESSNESVARINYEEYLLTLRAGRSIIKASLFDDNDLLCVVNLGEAIVIDPNDKNFIPINNLNEFSKMKKDGMYYLNENLEFNQDFQIPLFSGILINPNKCIIKGFNNNSNTNVSLFNKVNNAYIDGLIFENVEVEGNKNTTSVLASEVINSFISNVHVQGNVSNGYIASGIVGSLKDSIIKNSGFKGNVNNALYIGGIAGYMENSKLINTYVIGEVSSINTVSKTYIGGIVGLIDGGKIETSYFVGEVNYKENDFSSIIAYNTNSTYNLINIYYTTEGNASLYDTNYCISPIISYISLDELKSGNSIDGLNEFSFIKGEFPKI